MFEAIDFSGITVRRSFLRPSPVEELPGDFDLETWSKDPICFTVQETQMLKIYAVNPNDCSCYLLADFTFRETDTWFYDFYSYAAYCTVVDSKLYLLGRNDPDNHVLTDLWIWDISEAQKKKLAGEPYYWQLGPRPNSAKDMVLAFSLSGDLYALDICRAFYPSRLAAGMWETGSKSRDQNPIDFERLPISSSSHSSLSWVPLSPLRMENYPDVLQFNGYYCMQDRFFLHMSSKDPVFSYLFCYNVTTDLWFHRKISDFPVTTFVPEDLDVCYRKSLQYSAQVENHVLFINPYTGDLSVFDLSAVNDLLENCLGSESEHPFPFFRLDVDETTSMKHIVNDRSFNYFAMCQTFYLGGTRNCWIAFHYGFDFVLYACICTFDLEKKTSLEMCAKTSEKGSTKKREMVENTTFSAANDVARLWEISDNANVLPLSFPRCPR